jgi:hypothetical protein
LCRDKQCGGHQARRDVAAFDDHGDMFVAAAGVAPDVFTNGRLEHLRASVLGFRSLTNSTVRSLLKPADSELNYTLDH